MMKKTFVILFFGFMCIVSTAFFAYSGEIPSAAITVDGFANDWDGISAYALDPIGDTACGYGTDLKAVYFAKDSQYLYWRVDTHSGYIDPDYNPTIHFYQDPDGKSDNDVQARAWDNGTSGVVWHYSDQNGFVKQFTGEEYGRFDEVAEGKIPLSLFQNISIHKIFVHLYNQVCSSSTADGIWVDFSLGETTSCGAYIAPGIWKEFDCYNLAAIGKTTHDDPFTPAWRLIGGYWQWGRKGPDPSQWYDTNTPNFAHGPTGSGDSEANSNSISGWDQTYAPDGAWSDSYKTANDPCPDGFQVPTGSQWDGVLDNNTQSTVGTWANSVANYNSARFFGNSLMLPAAGYRYNSSGGLGHRGYYGGYWSSSESSSSNSWYMHFGSGYANMWEEYGRWRGFSIRCIAETEDPPCTYSISPNSGNFPAGGGTDIITVTTSDPECTWTTSNSLSWVNLSSTSGTGSKDVNVSVIANIGAARSGSITIAGQTYIIHQPGTGTTIETVSNSLGMNFVYVNPGSFMMGSPADEPGRVSDETLHQVNLTQGYYMQTTEVTQGQWEAVMGSNPSYFNECGSDCPVEKVSWHNIQEFLSRLNQRGEGIYVLPTEAQWEYAARAGSSNAFGNGPITETEKLFDPVLDSMGWYGYNSGYKSYPVAGKQPNAWGLYDMHGNVWEWVADWYGPYPSESVTDPEGPASGSSFVVRGGSFGSHARRCRSASRPVCKPDCRDYDVGFRLAALSMDHETPVLSVAPASRSVHHDSGTVSFDVSNTGTDTLNWNVAVISGGDWLTITEGTGGSDAGTIFCRHEPNMGDVPRTGVIQINAPDATNSPVDVKVTQDIDISFDDFEGPNINSYKWENLQLIRKVSDGRLNLGVETIDSSLSVGINSATSTDFLQADIGVSSASAMEGGASGYARIGGYFYNDTRGPGSGLPYNGVEGDIFPYAGLVVGSDGNLQAVAYVVRSNDAQGTQWSRLFSHDFSLPVTFDTMYTFSIEYTGTQLIFSCEGQTVHYSISTAVYEPSRVTRMLYSKIYAGTGQKGLFDTFYDNVALARSGLFYDEFESSDIDPAKWQGLKTVREVSDGRLNLGVETIDSSLSVGINSATSTDYLQAEIGVSSTSAIEGGASGYARIGGYFYNDSRGPGSGLPHNGEEGDIFPYAGLVMGSDGNLQAVAYVVRSDDSQGTQWSRLFSHDFSLPVSFDTMYTFSIEYTGSQFIFSCGGQTVQYSISTPTYEPSRTTRMLYSKIYADTGQKGMFDTFYDNVSSHKPKNRCGAYLAPGVWKEFDCYNLAAIGKSTHDDPFIPSWRLIGGYWQWGRKGPDPSQWYDTNTEHFAHGPTGPDYNEANKDSISGWDSNYAPDGAWSDSTKTANDPCPAGYRVPTKNQWRGIIENNTLSNVGSWSPSITNYNSAGFFGSDLMLPAAGDRSGFDGALDIRGNRGYYWSSTETGSDNAWGLNIVSGNAYTSDFYGGRRHGNTIRCISESDDENPSNPILSITPDSHNAGRTSGSVSFTVSNTGTGTMAWTASVISGENWLSIDSGDNGSDTGTIVCLFENNTEISSRTAIIQISAPDAANSPFEVTVTQEQGSPDPDPDILTHSSLGTSFTGQWTPVTALDAFQDESMVTQEDGASFTFDTGHTGCHTVSLWWSQDPERHDAVPVEIYDDITLLDTVYVNQQAGGGQWQELGTYYFEHGAVIVVVSDSSTHTTSVDAVQTTATDNCHTVSQVLVPGWNLLTPVHQTAGLMTASLWAADIDSQGAWITRVQKWDGTGWQSYSPGAPFGDFAIEPGQGYFVFNQAQNQTTWESIGMPVPCPMTYEFSAGWNLMGFPLGIHATASELAEAINVPQDHVTRIQKWDGSGWQSYTPGAPFGSFDIIPGQGYFLYSSQAQTSYTQACDGDGPVCGAYVAPDVWKEFDCYNLAAIGKSTHDDPFIPSWRLIGGYWQWGRKGPDSSQWYDTNTPNFAHGPTGPGSSEANSESISGWDSSDAPNGAWSDSSKTANDPCPAGYRVPTKAQWEGVDDNNTQSTVGTWDSDATNYSSGRFFGDDLMLPAAGYRYYYSGALNYRGSNGYYWSSSEGPSSSYARYLYFGSSSAYPRSYGRQYGRSVRCVAE
jgi:uncharacterized protein (TIGR02145 family)